MVPKIVLFTVNLNILKMREKMSKTGINEGNPYEYVESEHENFVWQCCKFPKNYKSHLRKRTVHLSLKLINQLYVEEYPRYS